MNDFKITIKEKTPGPHLVELTLCPEIDDLVMGPLKQLWLLEILAGEKRKLEDGRTYYSFSLPNDAAELVKQAFLTMYTQHTEHNLPN